MQASDFVLVVDDDPSILELIRDILDIEGYRTRTARGGKAALAIVEQARPAAILLDLVMPGLNGWEFLQHYHSTSHDPAPVIALTGLHDLSLLPAGVDEVVAKPFDVGHLLDKLERLASRAELAPSA